MFQRPGVWFQVSRNWNQFCEQAHKTWNKLTTDDLKEIGGDQQRLVACLQKRYGYPPEEASNQVDFWADELWI